MNKKEILNLLRMELKNNIDPNYKQGAQRYFKEKIILYGVRIFTVEKIAREYFKKLKYLEKKEILDLCEELFKGKYSEEKWIAANWANQIKKYRPSDFKYFERWVNKYIVTWADCDTLCNHALGSFIEQYPLFITKLKQWTKSKNRWMRRAAAVTLILPARKGLFLTDILEISDLLLTDSDDLVQKGYGWLLKEASKKFRKEIFEYVMKNKKVMPRTALRYAIEKMPQDLRKIAMDKA